MSTSTTNEEILFENNNWKLTANNLEIKWYYFPLGFSKIILISDIKTSQLDDPSLTHWSYKTWGMGVSPIWWACDLTRFWYRPDHRNLIVETVDDAYLKKAFSLGEGGDVGLEKLKTLLGDRLQLQA